MAQFEFVELDMNKVTKCRIRRTVSVDELTVEEYQTRQDALRERGYRKHYRDCQQLIDKVDTGKLGIMEMHLLQHIIEWLQKYRWLAKSQRAMLRKLGKGYNFSQIIPIAEDIHGLYQ